MKNQKLELEDQLKDAKYKLESS